MKGLLQMDKKQLTGIFAGIGYFLLYVCLMIVCSRWKWNVFSNERFLYTRLPCAKGVVPKDYPRITQGLPKD